MVENMSITLVNILLGLYAVFSVSLIVSMVQSIVYCRKSAKRDAERDARDKEYHEKRMQEYK
jgi:hypothetical protein